MYVLARKFLLLLVGAVVPAGARAAAPDFPADMPDGRVRTPDGATKYLLVVEEGFQPGALEAIGGTLAWDWPEAKLVAATSSSETFLEDARTTPGLGITTVVPAVLVLSEEQLKPTGPSGPPDRGDGGDKHDAYLENRQWPLQAIGAVRHPDGRTPEWQLDDIEGHDYRGAGTTVCFADSGMPVMDVGQGRLHEDYTWYREDAVGTPEEGGIVPVFRSDDELEAYYRKFGEAEGMDPSTAIIDAELGGFDWDGHSTSGSAIFNVRYKPGKDWALRGIAPGAKAISYATKTGFGGWQDISKVLAAFRRADDDGCQVLAHAFGFFFAKDELFPFGEEYRQILMHALQALDRQGILVTTPAGNWGVGVHELHQSAGGPWWVLPQWYPPNVLAISGSGPRDYDPDAPDLRVYDPAPGAGKGTEHNLDRPGVFEPPIYSTGFGRERGGVDLAAPSGSAPDLNAYFTPSSKRSPDYGYHAYHSATSQAMPTAAGVAALAIEAYTLAHGQPPTVPQLKSILTTSADDGVGPARDTIYWWNPERSKTGSFVLDLFGGALESWELVEVQVEQPGRDDFLGFGRINAYEAIVEARK